MTTPLAPLFTQLAAIPWLDILRTVSPVATAFIAYSALQNWKRQDRAKRQAEFLDQIIDATHQYVLEMQRPNALLRSARIGMAAHSPDYSQNTELENIQKGAINYIEKRGEKDGKRLREALTSVESSVVKLRSLSTKGQVFDFPDYMKCFNAVKILTWHYDRIISFSSIIDSPEWNWDNQYVQSLLEKVIEIDPDEIALSLSEQNAEVISFSRRVYGRLYS